MNVVLNASFKVWENDPADPETQRQLIRAWELTRGHETPDDDLEVGRYLAPLAGSDQMSADSRHWFRRGPHPRLAVSSWRHGNIDDADLRYLVSPDAGDHTVRAVLARNNLSLPEEVLRQMVNRLDPQDATTVLSHMGKMPSDLVTAAAITHLPTLHSLHTRDVMRPLGNRHRMPLLMALPQLPWGTRFMAAYYWLKTDPVGPCPALTALLSDYLAAGAPESFSTAAYVGEDWFAVDDEQLALMVEIARRVPGWLIPALVEQLDRELDARGTDPASLLLEVLTQGPAESVLGPGRPGRRLHRMWLRIPHEHRSTDLGTKLLLSPHTLPELVEELAPFHAAAAARLVDDPTTHPDPTKPVPSWLTGHREAFIAVARTREHVVGGSDSADLLLALAGDYANNWRRWCSPSNGALLAATLLDRGHVEDATVLMRTMPARLLLALADQDTRVAAHVSAELLTAAEQSDSPELFAKVVCETVDSDAPLGDAVGAALAASRADSA